MDRWRSSVTPRFLHVEDGWTIVSPMTMLVEPNLVWGHYLKKLCFCVIQFEKVCGHPVTNCTHARREVMLCSFKITVEIWIVEDVAGCHLRIYGSVFHGM